MIASKKGPKKDRDSATGPERKGGMRKEVKIKN